MSKRAIVVGAGIAGIATSIRLAKQGFSVEVFEASPHPGGKMSAFETEGYRFDGGPSLFTLAHLVDELFLLCDEDPIPSATTFTKMAPAFRPTNHGTIFPHPWKASPLNLSDWP